MKVRALFRKLHDAAKLARCICTCRGEPAEYDKDCHQWRCTKCGAKWGGE